ncbi:TKL protein kinase [Saprolegnia parasitica CBS 223.65]|uniref:TKL protein kinase n=1 Tax=Saprolegnia parasitica (strain CBS 223.65) TaxID=695850 RepID=A0A067CZU8_SAPPC|nr:TKL protein kinase [Saprolegnia parasitica CBS 223.65]KDO34780.1 TKL protein kinase [Saprolegnia parasitica CBS 223.65]|eukprot:XP_012194447.1 TKL protein kinase [Saprolegnia parasitica CBS 223.65]
MGDIAVNFATFLNGHVPLNNRTECQSAGNTTVLRSQNCDGKLSDAMAKCAIDLNGFPDGHSSQLAQDDLPLSDVPEPRVFQHEDVNAGWTKPAIHTQPHGRYPEAPWGSCPLPGRSALTIPCEVRNQRAESTNRCLPAPSAAMDDWLTAYYKTSQPQPTSETSDTNHQVSPSNPTVQLIGIGIGGVFGLVFLLYLIRCLFQRRAAHPSKDPSVSPRIWGPRSTRLLTSSNAIDSSPVAAASSSAQFQHDPRLLAKRLAYKDVVCDRVLSRSAAAEVWVGRLGTETVAIKKTLSPESLDVFTEEIRVMARLTHHNIVRFHGFAWDNRRLSSLVAVTEYLAQGDLPAFLQRHRAAPWSTKLLLALDIARALAYLHEEANVLHRGLKPKNVLVIDSMHCKLSATGLRRDVPRDDAFYTAPEVLYGEPFTREADLYAFGCILVELDRHEPVYSDLHVAPLVVLNEILSENLRPAVSPSCPEAVRLLASECLAKDPRARPMALNLYRELEWMRQNEEWEMLSGRALREFTI